MGACPAGYSGTPIRNCSLAGAWIDVLTGSTACTRTGACPHVHAGSRTDAHSLRAHARVCTDGTVELTCASTSDGTTSFPSTTAGTTANGVCAAGYSGSPQRTCAINGAWLAPSGVSCARTSCLTGAIFWGALAHRLELDWTWAVDVRRAQAARVARTTTGWQRGWRLPPTRQTQRPCAMPATCAPATRRPCGRARRTARGAL